MIRQQKIFQYPRKLLGLFCIFPPSIKTLPTPSSSKSIPLLQSPHITMPQSPTPTNQHHSLTQTLNTPPPHNHSPIPPSLPTANHLIRRRHLFPHLGNNLSTYPPTHPPPHPLGRSSPSTGDGRFILDPTADMASHFPFQ